MACCSITNNIVFALAGGLASQDRSRAIRARPVSRLCVYAVSSATSGGEGNVQGQQQSGDNKQGVRVQPFRGRQTAMGRRRADSPLGLLDYWDPFSTGGLRQMMDVMDNLYLDAMPQSYQGGGGVRSPWDVVEDDEGYYVRVDMPGFAKEDVKVSVEDGVLVIGGERDAAKEDGRWAAKSYRNFNTRLALPEDASIESIKAELKNGVLSVSVRKKKPEEKKQVVDVQVA